MKIISYIQSNVELTGQFLKHQFRKRRLINDVPCSLVLELVYSSVLCWCLGKGDSSTEVHLWLVCCSFSSVSVVNLLLISINNETIRIEMGEVYLV